MAKWFTRNRLLAACAVIAVFLVAGLSLLYVARDDGEQDDVVDNALSFAEEQTDAGNYDQALDALRQSLEKAQSTEEKLRVLGSLAAAAANAGKLSEAIGYYEQKHQLDPSDAASDGLLVGELYERLGETELAIQQFETYVGYITSNPTSENAEARINSLKARIEQLKEAGQQ